jgi:hypothetical protein
MVKAKKKPKKKVAKKVTSRKKGREDKKSGKEVETLAKKVTLSLAPEKKPRAELKWIEENIPAPREVVREVLNPEDLELQSEEDPEISQQGFLEESFSGTPSQKDERESTDEIYNPSVKEEGAEKFYDFETGTAIKQRGDSQTIATHMLRESTISGSPSAMRNRDTGLRNVGMVSTSESRMGSKQEDSRIYEVGRSVNEQGTAEPNSKDIKKYDA